MTGRDLDEEAIFHVARGMGDPNLRSIYLDQVCAGDQALRERVEAMLKVHEQEQNFLKSSQEPTPTIDQTPISEGPGTSVGRYRLMEQIGEGGMGVVFVAEQERPIRRKVAIKIVKPGMDTKEVIARFEAERQALALMDHPNIAKVLDAGTTESGRPYFVMELVRGIPFTDYCDQNKLTITERLRLFVSICQAVQRAHQKGIIHRDLKPTNVLVTLHDGIPVPKVIDFGVAKATNQKLTERTIYTRFAQMIGTPIYMSPEQAEMSGLDVDTRSDIYSLGVLLYELLTGTTPFDKERFAQAAYDEIRRIVREEQPPKPSTKISTLGEPARSISEHRGTDQRRLCQQVRGDLDWIIMKALEKDRTRRYETATNFAADIQRFLANEPIEARAPSTAYRLAKAASRHRIALATTAVVALALLIGIAAALRFAVKEREARDNVERLMARLQSHFIEKALQHVVEGELEKVESTLGEYEARIDLDDDEKWLPTLKGAYHVHRAEFKDAIEILEPVVKNSPDNLAAAGLLAWSYLTQGYWEKGAVLASKIKGRKPRKEFQDFDLLFQGYGLYFVDYDLSVKTFQGVVERNPTWGIARLMLAHSLAQRASDGDQLDDIDNAVRQMRIAKELVTKKNAWVLIVQLFVNQEVIRLHSRHSIPPEQTEEAYQDGLKLVRKLQDDYPDNDHGNWVIASFYDTIGRKEEADQAWLRVLASGSDASVYCAIGRFYAEHTSEETMQRIEQLDSVTLSPTRCDRLSKRSMEKQPKAAATGRYYSFSTTRGLESVKLLPSALAICNSVVLFRCRFWAREARNGSVPFGRRP